MEMFITQVDQYTLCTCLQLYHVCPMQIQIIMCQFTRKNISKHELWVQQQYCLLHPAATALLTAIPQPGPLHC